MKARYSYRIYPTDRQAVSLAQLFGCCRVAWNNTLAFCQEQYLKGDKKPKDTDLIKRLTQLKKSSALPWLTEVSSVPLQQSIRDLGVAYSNFFNSCKGQRKGIKVKPPKFKKRRGKQTARFTDNAFKVLPDIDCKSARSSAIGSRVVYLAKIGELEIVWSRKLPSIPSSVTVIKDAANRYFLSFVVEVTPTKLPDNGKAVGIDLGITTFATLSTGEKIEAPKPLKKQLRKLKRLQKNLSRKTKGSKRREVARLKVAKLHAQIKDTRNDFLHKLTLRAATPTTKIIRENQSIVLEDLAVSNMVKNRKLSRAISDLGWRTFRDMLSAKALMYGRDFRIISRWEPTSQRCSTCQQIGGKKALNVREWTCLYCGTKHDRDVNASINILNTNKVGSNNIKSKLAEGHSDSINGRGGSVSLGTKQAVSRVGVAARSSRRVG